MLNMNSCTQAEGKYCDAELILWASRIRIH